MPSALEEYANPTLKHSGCRPRNRRNTRDKVWDYRFCSNSNRQRNRRRYARFSIGNDVHAPRGRKSSGSRKNESRK